jgi:hypothetical protein
MEKILHNVDREHVMMFAIAVIALAICFWFGSSYVGSDNYMEEEQALNEEQAINEEFEQFNANGEEGAVAEIDKANGEASPGNGGVSPPFVNPKTGTIMDGPGFERGEVEGAYLEDPSGVPSNYYILDDGAGGEMSIQHNLCSKSCCSEQWPTPFKQKYDPYVCGAKSKGDFVSSNVFCNNSFNDSGCLCLSKKQSRFLYNRGGNGREWF